MFKNDYQGGPYFEIFSVQGNQPISKLKISGPESSVRTKYDKDLRTFILILEGESTTSKIALPKNSKHNLHLTQQYLVFQIFIYPGRSFSLEVSLTNKSNLKQRIILSSSHREVVISSLHVKMPCSVIETNVWLNLCLDLDGLMKSLFDGWCMQTIDSAVVSANCKLKRIFTLKENPLDKLGVPDNMQFRGENSATQVIDMDSFINAGINIRSGTGNANNRRPPSYKSPSTRKKDTHISSKLHRNSGFIPKVKHSDLRNRSEGTSSDEKEVTDRSKVIKNDLACCGTAIVLPKLPKIPMENETKQRIVKSAEYLKSKICYDLNEYSAAMSKSADTRDRRLSDISHASSYIKLRNLQSSTCPDLRWHKIHSKSTIDLGKISMAKEQTLLFKSQSLQVLPGIKKQGEELPKRSEKLLKQNEDFSSVDNCNSSNPIVNLISPDREKDLVETDSMILGDDNMVDEYLQGQISNGEEESISISSSGCATSSGSDLFLYTSSPHSVSHEMDSENQTDINESISRPSKNLSNNAEPTDECVTQTPRNSQNSIVSPLYDKPGIMPAYLSNITSNELDTEYNVDSDYSTENNPVSSSPDFSGNRHADENYFTDSLDEKCFSTVNVKRKVSGPLQDESEIADLSSMTDIKLSKSPKSNHLDTLYCMKNSFALRESTESDTMSWLNTSVDQSLCMTDRRFVANKTSKSTKCAPHMVLQKCIEETLGSFINQSIENTDDGFSDSSDEGLNHDKLLKKIKNYRYQDEIKSLSCTLDLSATIPATPPVGDQLRYRKDENNNISGPHGKLHFSEKEELLDLLFDPVLNCYYDPKTQKYYELS